MTYDNYLPLGVDCLSVSGVQQPISLTPRPRARTAYGVVVVRLNFAALPTEMQPHFSITANSDENHAAELKSR
jgi:hypothetical protein